MCPTKTEILHAYRSLYRSGLFAIQYSTPARYIYRDRLRRAFRASPISDFEPQRIANTLEFLDGAAKSTGMEHHVLKNVLHVWFWEKEHWSRLGMDTSALGYAFKLRAYDHFYFTLRMLNESMGLCLR